MLVVPGRTADVGRCQCLGLGIVGYLIPVCAVAFVGSDGVKPLSLLVFIPSGAYNSLEGVRL